jgi:G:T-mismatch repair DNA endonuclease (very short patch repair protein)
MKTITNTHLKRHGMTKIDYLRAYPKAFLGACEWLSTWRHSEENKNQLLRQAKKVVADPTLIARRNENRNRVMKTNGYRENLSRAMKAYAQTENGQIRFANKPVTVRMKMSNFDRWVEDYGVDIAMQKQLEWQSKNVLPTKSRHTKIELIVAAALRDAGYNVVTQLCVPRYYCDIYVPQLKLIVEVNGDYWHANPVKFSGDDVIGHKRMTASQIWKRDAKKVEILRQMGYNVVTVWESDIKASTSLQLVEDIVRHVEKSS